MINKRTVYNKAIDAIVDQMVIGHENEADEFIHFHDSIPGGLTASAERTVNASHDEIVAITQYRYNMREMFNTNEFNKNPKNDVFRYMHLSEVIKPENLIGQKITILGGITSDTKVVFEADINSSMSDPIIVTYDEDPTIWCILSSIDIIKGYCSNDYIYRTVNYLSSLRIQDTKILVLLFPMRCIQTCHFSIISAGSGTTYS